MFQGKFVSMETRRCSTHNCVSRGGGRREEFEERREIWVVEVVPPPPTRAHRVSGTVVKIARGEVRREEVWN